MSLQLHIHQTHSQAGNFEKALEYLKNEPLCQQDGIHLFPELFFTGYPLLDLVLQKFFYTKYQESLEQLNQWSKAQKKDPKRLFLVGGLFYQFDEDQLPLKVENVIYALSPGKELEKIYTKQLLPNYDIFDEQKYFVRGKDSYILEFEEKKMGLLICEDMWHSSHHEVDPVLKLQEETQTQNIHLDAIINLSASPFFIGKQQKRITRASEISQAFGCPFIYINQVGLEDEVLFDGQSFVLEGEKLSLQAKHFEKDFLTYILPEKKFEPKGLKHKVSNTWEDLFKARISNDKKPSHLLPLTDNDCENIVEALKYALQDYAEKCGFQKFSIALSGGLDSALVLAIAKLSLKEGQYLEAIFMPGFYTSSESYDLSFKMAQNLEIPFFNFPIKFIHSTIRQTFQTTFKSEMAELSDENIQSRLRGSLLYSRSNQLHSMVLNTSNKSEIAVGYSTLYGDSVGALSLLGDLYKSEVAQVCQYINKKYGEIIPEMIITRPPSAELRDGQTDEQSLPPYPVLDTILEGILSYRYSKEDLINSGFNPETIEQVVKLYERNEYKRYQFCPIVKLKGKSFGFGHRIPITKKNMIN